MKITWSLGSLQILEMMSAPRQKSVRSEVSTTFSDSIPFPVQSVPGSPNAKFLELPCGVEVGFEEAGNGVRILFLIGALEDAVHAQLEQIQSQMTLEYSGFFALHDGA